MDDKQRTPNRLIDETSPYLLQHAYNPVEWYPWGEEAFNKARAEDKPVFLSVGYSTCHWCHVMAHESFEDEETAAILNRHFVSIKVDREERPDVDSVYMAACQAFTGSGGWPMSIFMTAEQKPFFAGTYYPKDARYGSVSFKELLLAICENWQSSRKELLRSAERVVAALNAPQAKSAPNEKEDIIESAFKQLLRSYDARNGGFGSAPKFPAAHNLLFLMDFYQKRGDKRALDMATHTLRQMYRGGMFDHIGFGFCRYSTDPYFLAPHFEKMLYDNALLTEAYCAAYELTKDPFYKEVAEKTAIYVLRDLRSPDGAFYSAQDADSEGEEGRFYLFTPQEVIAVLGDSQGCAFNRRYDITQPGNFPGGSIPNLLKAQAIGEDLDGAVSKLYEYRRKRHVLHTDTKTLTSWNALMIAALCSLYRISREKGYLDAAVRAYGFIESALCSDDTLFAGAVNARRLGEGFLDDYAACIHALLALYGATLNGKYIARADELTKKAIASFYDKTDGGFYISGASHEALVLRPKETYDGAMPSGNSFMTCDMLRLERLLPDEERERTLQAQLTFMRGEAAAYPAGYCMFLTALSNVYSPPPIITVSPAGNDEFDELPFLAGLFAHIRLLPAPTAEYPLLNGMTTYYICNKNACLPPTNERNALREAIS